MTFRLKIFTTISLTAAAAVALVGGVVSVSVSRHFAQQEEQRTLALFNQFRREFHTRADEVARRLQSISSAETTLRLAIEWSQSGADLSPWVNEARQLAATQDLDFLEIATHDGNIISSAHYPARFGYVDDLLVQWLAARESRPFLDRIETAEEVLLGLMAVRTVRAGDKEYLIAGGLRLDSDFLFSLSLPEGMRILLYRHLEPAFSSRWLSDAAGSLPRADQLAPFVTEILHAPRQLSRTVNWSSDPGDAEAFHSIPLWGRNQNLLAILLVGNSRRELANLTAFIRWMALAVGTGGILLGLLVSGWMSYRITQPLQDLSQGARAVASGDWSVKVKAKSRDEIGQLTLSFNEMTRQLVEQRERLIQVERVAAWRELARRLAHELKNPLFPLQITIENLQRAKNEHPEQFDEVFQESTGTLLVELSNLKDIINRFSEFARMPPPRFELTHLHEVVDQVLKLYEARFVMPGQPPVRVARDFDPQIPVISADPEQLSRALQNLVLNALDAMPQGGNLSLRTSSRTGGVRLEIIDSGSGLTKEECTRLFTPYYTTKRLGTGLGLAIVQSVVSDHGGTIVVESAPGQGTTFRIDLPEKSG